MRERARERAENRESERERIWYQVLNSPRRFPYKKRTGSWSSRHWRASSISSRRTLIIYVHTHIIEKRESERDCI